MIGRERYTGSLDARGRVLRDLADSPRLFKGGPLFRGRAACRGGSAGPEETAPWFPPSVARPPEAEGKSALPRGRSESCERNRHVSRENLRSLGGAGVQRTDCDCRWPRRGRMEGARLQTASFAEGRPLLPLKSTCAFAGRLRTAARNNRRRGCPPQARPSAQGLGKGRRAGAADDGRMADRAGRPIQALLLRRQRNKKRAGVRRRASACTQQSGTCQRKNLRGTAERVSVPYGDDEGTATGPQSYRDNWGL